MSDNLNFEPMVSSPTPEQGTNLFNTMKGQIDAVLSGAGEEHTATYNSDGSVDIVAADLEHFGGILLPDTGSGTSDFDVVFASGIERLAIIVINNNVATATLKFAGQSSPPTLTSGQAAIVTLSGDVVRAVVLTGS